MGQGETSETATTGKTGQTSEKGVTDKLTKAQCHTKAVSKLAYLTGLKAQFGSAIISSD